MKSRSLALPALGLALSIISFTSLAGDSESRDENDGLDAYQISIICSDINYSTYSLDDELKQLKEDLDANITTIPIDEFKDGYSLIAMIAPLSRIRSRKLSASNCTKDSLRLTGEPDDVDACSSNTRDDEICLTSELDENSEDRYTRGYFYKIQKRLNILKKTIKL